MIFSNGILQIAHPNNQLFKYYVIMSWLQHVCSCFEKRSGTSDVLKSLFRLSNVAIVITEKSPGSTSVEGCSPFSAYEIAKPFYRSTKNVPGMENPISAYEIAKSFFQIADNSYEIGNPISAERDSETSLIVYAGCHQS